MSPEPFLDALIREWPKLALAAGGGLLALWRVRRVWLEKRRRAEEALQEERAQLLARISVLERLVEGLTGTRAREEQRLQGKSVRYLLDALRRALHTLVLVMEKTPLEEQDREQLVRHRELIGHVSDELYVFDGHASERELRRKADLDRWLTRTQAIKFRVLEEGA